MMNMKDSKELYEKYGEDYLKFNEAHEKEQIKRQEIVQLEDQYKIISEKEKGLNIEQQEIMQVSEMNLPNEERKIKEEVQEQFNETQKEYECAVKNITEKRNNRKTANQEFRSRGIAKFKEEGCILSKQSLSNLDQKLYEYASNKEILLDENMKKENEIEDIRNKINLDTDKELTVLQRKQNDIVKEYESVIENQENIIQIIEEKYIPGIKEIEEKIRDIEEKYEGIISEINYQRSKEVELYVTDKNALEKQYKETNKRFKKQINIATKRNEPVAKLKAQHNSALQGIKDSITKIDSNINKVNFKYDKQIDDAMGKQQKELNISFDEKDKLVEAKKSELEKPQKELNEITNERNVKIDNLENEKKELEQGREKRLIESEDTLKEFQVNTDAKLEELKKELIKFAIDNGLAVAEKSVEAFEPFEQMEKNLPVWMKAVAHFIPRLNGRNDKIDSCRNYIENITYEQLVSIAEESNVYTKSVPFYLKGLNDKIAIAFSFSFLIGTILAFLLNLNIIVSYSLPILLSGVYSYVAIKKKRELQNKYCRFIFLANNYKTLQQINSRVQLLTENATYEKANEMADSIYKKVSGPELLQKKFEDEEYDIDKDYANEIALAKEKHEKCKEIIISEEREKILELRSGYINEQKKRSRKLEEINSKIDIANKEKNKLTKDLEKVHMELKSYEEVIDSFEKEHTQFKKNLLYMSAPVEKTEGILRDDIYLIPTDYEQCSDKNGHLPFIHILHEKHPMLVILDTQDIPKDGTYRETLGNLVKNCLLDFTLAFKNMNGNEIIEQYIVDEISGGHQLRSENYTNLLEIKKVTESIYDMRPYFSYFRDQRERLSTRGTTLSEYNMKQSQKGERPGVYEICYIVFENERCSGFKEHVSSLMKNGWDYGFIPVFICEKEIWENNKDKAETVLNEISMNVTTIIKFNGKKYEELDNE